MFSAKRYDISEETLNRTTCRNDFHCLSGNSEDLCEIIDTVGSSVVLTFCPQKGLKCPYCKALTGAVGICSCPTRNELYNRHGV